MTEKQFYNKLLKITDNVAYVKFNREVKTPFIQYGLPSNDDFIADNKHFIKVRSGWLELYCSKFDEMFFNLRDDIENMFNESGLVWDKVNEDCIDSEKLVFVRFSFSL